MGKLLVDPEEIRFLHSHGWTITEIARKLGRSPNTIAYHVRKFEASRTEFVPLETVKESIKTTRERIEFLLAHHNPCEFTWEENLIELLRGFNRLIARKKALGG